jgi:NADH dehydrogenase (ubiquinone) Fe-S protein 6
VRCRKIIWAHHPILFNANTQTVHSPSTLSMLNRSAARICSSISRLSRSLSSQAPSVPSAKPSAAVTGQSPNYPKTWSTSQRPREDIYSQVRFEQTDLEYQPQPLSAMEMINSEPIRIVHGRKAVCDGGMCIAASPPQDLHFKPSHICLVSTLLLTLSDGRYGSSGSPEDFH